MVSEVVRYGSEEAEHRRLLEKNRVPPALLEHIRAHFRQLADTALRDVANDRVTDGPAAMQRLRERIEAQG